MCSQCYKKETHTTLLKWKSEIFGVDLPFCCSLRFDDLKEGDVVRHDGKRSDGYLEHIFKHAAKELFGVDVKEITYKALK